MTPRRAKVLALLAGVTMTVGACSSDATTGTATGSTGSAGVESRSPTTASAPPPPFTATNSSVGESAKTNAPSTPSTPESTPTVSTGSTASAPLLGLPFAPYQKGFGTVKPSAVDNGGDPTGNFTIAWDTWGGPEADGHGTALWAPKIVADGRTETALFRAYDPGTCKGKSVYLHLAVWFPQHGQHFDPKTNGEANYLLCPS